MKTYMIWLEWELELKESLKEAKKIWALIT